MKPPIHALRDLTLEYWPSFFCVSKVWLENIERTAELSYLLDFIWEVCVYFFGLSIGHFFGGCGD